MSKLYRLPKKATIGTEASQSKWNFSKQHMFELGRWDLKTGPNKEDAQMSMGGVARTSETWDQAEPSLVRIWRLAGPKITYENLTQIRVQNNATYLDPHTNLPKQKYDELFKLSVLKKWDLWKNAQDCGHGAALSTVYPPLTAEEKTQRTKLIEENKSKRANSRLYDEVESSSEEEDSDDSDSDEEMEDVAV